MMLTRIQKFRSRYRKNCLFHVMLKYSDVSVICHVHVVVASPSASAPVVSSSGAFSAATASVLSQSASALNVRAPPAVHTNPRKRDTHPRALTHTHSHTRTHTHTHTFTQELIGLMF